MKSQKQITYIDSSEMNNKEADKIAKEIAAMKSNFINLINANNGKITINIPKNNSLSARTFKKYYYEDKNVVTQKLNHINNKIDKIIHHMDQQEQSEQHEQQEQHEQHEQHEQSEGMTDASN